MLRQTGFSRLLLSRQHPAPGWPRFWFLFRKARP